MNSKSLIISSLLLSSVVFGAEFDSETLYERESLWSVFSTRSKIRLCRIGKLEDKIKLVKSMKVYFDNDSSNISAKQINEIDVLMKSNYKKGYRIFLEVHSDIEGNAIYNKTLSSQRIKSVLDVIRASEAFVEDTKIKSKIHGESKSTVRDRVDRIVEIRIEKINNDKSKFNKVFLFDASKSMARGNTDSGLRYQEIRNYKLPIDAMGYVVRDINTKCDGSKLQDYDPKGPAVLKEGMYVIAKNLIGSAKVMLYTNSTQKIKDVDQKSLDEAVQITVKQNKTMWYQF